MRCRRAKVNELRPAPSLLEVRRLPPARGGAACQNATTVAAACWVAPAPLGMKIVKAGKSLGLTSDARVQAGVLRDVTGLGRPPLRGEDQPGLHQLQPVEEGQDLFPGPGDHG